MKTARDFADVPPKPLCLGETSDAFFEVFFDIGFGLVVDRVIHIGFESKIQSILVLKMG
jgi:hypothetical protein